MSQSPLSSFSSAPAGRDPGPWRVLLADDHAILREGVALLVEQQHDMHVVAQARGGREAVQMAEEHRPDVVVLDVAMPDLAGPEVAEQIRAGSPRSRVLALTRHADQGYLRRMLRAGAAGYVVKRAAADALVTAIRTVAEGGTYVDPSLAGALVARSVSRHEAVGAVPRTRPPLSEREEQVLRLIAWGKSNKEVAAQLGISVKTAEFYKAAALEKLQIRTRTDILRHALAERWLVEDEGPD
ncbi:response regulator transcription factor [Aquabacterium sp. J223]|uniref:response regulator transcription factor n=1 Tax=Aquabacterium sp. J223 TaxID=2898431 RepID=UPI0021ADB007|nr:response regulator transcription factor [Aquabacterium sp. J223]UUX95048.1 response regulator transcription factor [Aquabacterium sp. J223]